MIRSHATSANASGAPNRTTHPLLSASTSSATAFRPWRRRESFPNQLSLTASTWPPRENYVVTMLFDRDRPAREVAQTLHVNESRISEIKRRALGKLRANLTATPSARAA